MAIIAPGIFLSQPPMASRPSTRAAPQTVSMESAMTSRETSEYFMPSVPMEMPSLTVMVPKICGMACRIRAAIRMARSARSFRPALHGRDGAVAVGDADDGLVEIAVAEADRAQHGAIGSALDALGDQFAAFIGAHFFAFWERLSLLVAVSRDASEILNWAIENIARVSMHEDETRKNKTSAAKAIFVLR